jgi:hypothetical protein
LTFCELAVKPNVASRVVHWSSISFREWEAGKAEARF